jgi:hypothetical protein
MFGDTGNFVTDTQETANANKDVSRAGAQAFGTPGQYRWRAPLKLSQF